MNNEIKEVLEEHFKDYYSIEEGCIILHFPKLTIKGKDRTHVIYDLFFKIYVVGTTITGFYGLRKTYSTDEYASKFTHVFLSGLNLKFSAFCLGRSFMTSYIGKDLTADLLGILLFDIRAYLTYDDSTAGPYRRLSNITHGSSTLNYSSNDVRIANTNFKNKVNLKKVKLQFNAGKVNIVKNSYLIDLLEECIELKGYVIDGECYPTLNQDISIEDNSPLVFNGKTYSAKIINTYSNGYSIMSAHPKIIDEVIEDFETLLNSELNLKIKYEFKYRKKARSFRFI